MVPDPLRRSARTPLPRHHELILARGPYEVDAERALLERVDVLVTKDSGGGQTSAKLTAARELRKPVLIVRRPPRPAAETATTVPEAVEWVLRR